MIAADDRSPEAFRTAVQDVLGNLRYRQTAERLRDEMTRLPGLEQAVHWLERLATEQQPLLAGSSIGESA